REMLVHGMGDSRKAENHAHPTLRARSPTVVPALLHVERCAFPRSLGPSVARRWRSPFSLAAPATDRAQTTATPARAPTRTSHRTGVMERSPTFEAMAMATTEHRAPTRRRRATR